MFLKVTSSKSLERSWRRGTSGSERLSARMNIVPTKHPYIMQKHPFSMCSCESDRQQRDTATHRLIVIILQRIKNVKSVLSQMKAEGSLDFFCVFWGNYSSFKSAHLKEQKTAEWLHLWTLRWPQRGLNWFTDRSVTSSVMWPTFQQKSSVSSMWMEAEQRLVAAQTHTGEKKPWSRLPSVRRCLA